MFGCIDETELSLRYPRMIRWQLIDGDEHKTVESAWEQALQMLQDGAEKVTVCQAKYYGDDGNGFWGETQDAFKSISIEAGAEVDWLRENDDE